MCVFMFKFSPLYKSQKKLKVTGINNRTSEHDIQVLPLYLSEFRRTEKVNITFINPIMTS